MKNIEKFVIDSIGITHQYAVPIHFNRIEFVIIIIGMTLTL